MKLPLRSASKDISLILLSQRLIKQGSAQIMQAFYTKA